MEQNGDQNDPQAIIPHEANTNKTTESSLRKTKRSKNIFKVALFMMRGRSRKSKTLVKDDESNSVWRKLVGSMRPLHLQDDPSSPQNNDDSDNNDDGFESASEFTYSSSPTTSRYASAVGLNEMVQEEEVVKENNDNNNINNDDIGEGDEMIDAKAEEFIAQFYYQMRLQRFDIMDPHYEEISMRSLGL